MKKQKLFFIIMALVCVFVTQVMATENIVSDEDISNVVLSGSAVTVPNTRAGEKEQKSGGLVLSNFHKSDTNIIGF